jgi:hypothetical protein
VLGGDENQALVSAALLLVTASTIANLFGATITDVRMVARSFSKASPCRNCFNNAKVNKLANDNKWAIAYPEVNFQLAVKICK